MLYNSCLLHFAASAFTPHVTRVNICCKNRETSRTKLIIQSIAHRLEWVMAEQLNCIYFYVFIALDAVISYSY